MVLKFQRWTDPLRVTWLRHLRRWNLHPPSIISLLYTLININHCTYTISNDRLPEIGSETRIRSKNFIWNHMRRILFFMWKYQNFDMSKFSVNTRISSKFSRYFFLQNKATNIETLFYIFHLFFFMTNYYATSYRTPCTLTIIWERPNTYGRWDRILVHKDRKRCFRGKTEHRAAAYESWRPIYPTRR